MNPYLMLGKYACRMTLLAMIASTLMAGFLGWHGAQLRCAGTGVLRGILALELCCTPTNANGILWAWGKSVTLPQTPNQLIHVAIEDIYWDFLFIPSYGVAIMLFCGAVATVTTGRWSQVTVVLGWSMLVAGSLDVVENIGMLAMLQPGPIESPFFPVITTVSAVIKWALIIPACSTAIFSIPCARKKDV